MGKKCYTLTFLCVLFLLPLLHITTADQDFSELENRMLAQLPRLEKTAVLDGSFGDAVEDYLADQFPFRNQFLSLKLYAELALGKRESNGVYIGKEGQLLQDFQTPDTELLKKNASYINALGEELETSILLAPTATSIYKERLPLFATPYDENTYLEEVRELLSAAVRFVDVRPALLEHKGEAIYYKTDHHWTMLGAFYAYQTLCHEWGIVPKELSDFQREIVSTSFYGSLFSTGNVVFAKPDSLELFYPRNPVQLQVENLAEGTSSDSVYAMEYLEKKDKYSIFLDNNQPILVIRTLAGNGKKLLVVKDSYANCLLPFLTAHFEEIHILDLRYLNLPVQAYARQNAVEKVLLLYNVQDFSRNTKLSLLKEAAEEPAE